MKEKKEKKDSTTSTKIKKTKKIYVPKPFFKKMKNHHKRHTELQHAHCYQNKKSSQQESHQSASFGSYDHHEKAKYKTKKGSQYKHLTQSCASLPLNYKGGGLITNPYSNLEVTKK